MLLINIVNGILFLPDLINSPIAPNMTAIILNTIPAIAKSCLASTSITYFSLSNARDNTLYTSPHIVPSATTAKHKFRKVDHVLFYLKYYIIIIL